MAICGDTCTITNAEFNSIEAHILDYSLTSNEVDVRSFEDANAYGEFLACAATGSLTVQTYLRPAVAINDAVSVTANVNSEVYTFPCKVTGISGNIDAKGVVGFTTNLRVTDTPTFV